MDTYEIPMETKQEKTFLISLKFLGNRHHFWRKFIRSHPQTQDLFHSV